MLPWITGGMAFLMVLLHFDLQPVVGDEGVCCMDAWRMASGQIPQADFFEIIPPATHAFLALFYLILGPTVWSTRLAGSVCGAALVLVVGLLSFRLARRPLHRAIPLALLIPFGVGVWPFPSHHWLVSVLQMAAMVCLLRAAERAAPAWAFVGGVLGGLGVLTLQDQGIYGLLAVPLLFLPFLPAGDRRRVFASWLGGAAAVGLASAALVLPHVSVATLLHDWCLFPAGQYHEIPDNVVGFSEGWLQILGQWNPAAFRIAPVYSATIAINSLLVYLLPLAAAPALILLWRSEGFPRHRWGLVAGFTLAFLGGAMHRWSLMNLIWAAPVPALAVSLCLDRLGGEHSPRLRRAGTVIGAILLCPALLFGVLRAKQIFVQDLHGVVAPAGSYRTFNPTLAEDLQAFVDAVEERIPPGEPVFCRGYVPLLNFLTLRPNPTPYTIMITPGYNTPEQVGRWKASLEDQGVLWGFAPAYRPSPEDAADRYLLSRFHPVWQNGRYMILRRSEAPISREEPAP